MYYDNLKLEKGMYSIANKSFTQVLEEADPSKNYDGSPLSGLDAFERQLKRFDLKVAGAGSDVVEKFFATTTSAALFPEYVSRAVNSGMEENDILSDIVASTTDINGLDYRSISCSISDLGPSPVAEGDTIPTATISVKGNLIKLLKRGSILSASYEAIRFQRLDLFTVALKQLGAQIRKAQLKDAVSVIINGDNATSNNKAVLIDAAVSGKVSYADLLVMIGKLDPYELNTILVSPANYVGMLTLDEFKNPLTGINIIGTGKLISPLGANLFKTSAVGDGIALGIDKNYALEMVTAGGLSVEYDKLIDKQLERAAVTSIAGFAKIFDAASCGVEL